MFASEEAFAVAVRHHQAGRPDEAAVLYEQVLRENPAHAGASHLLGVVHRGRGNLDTALRHIEHALALCRTKAVYWNNYGAVLKELGRVAEAKTAFEQALRIRVAYPRCVVESRPRPGRVRRSAACRAIPASRLATRSASCRRAAALGTPEMGPGPGGGGAPALPRIAGGGARPVRGTHAAG
jgi:tetratricopeptide (TPR) repeat protein